MTANLTWTGDSEAKGLAIHVRVRMEVEVTSDQDLARMHRQMAAAMQRAIAEVMEKR